MEGGGELVLQGGGGTAVARGQLTAPLVLGGGEKMWVTNHLFFH